MAKILTTPVPELPATGIDPLQVARNEVAVSAVHANPALSLLNGVAGRRMKVLFSHYVDPGTTINDGIDWRFQAHTSPNCNRIIVDMIIDVASSSGAGATPPFAEWTTTPVGGAARTQSQIVIPFDPNAVPSPSTYIYRRQVWTDLDGSTPTIADTTFRAEQDVQNCLPISCVIYEAPRDAYDIFSPPSAVIGFSSVVQGANVFRSFVATFYNQLDKLWERQGQRIFNWTQDQGIGASVVTGTTAQNIHDTSLTAYGANTPGYWHRTKDRGTRSSNNIPCVAWTYATSSTGTGVVSFVGSGGTFGSINVTTAGWYSTTFNMDASQTSQKIDVFAVASDVAENISVAAVGVYEYQA